MIYINYIYKQHDIEFAWKLDTPKSSCFVHVWTDPCIQEWNQLEISPAKMRAVNMAKHVDVWVTIQQKYVYFNLFNHDLTVDSKKWIIYNQKKWYLWMKISIQTSSTKVTNPYFIKNWTKTEIVVDQYAGHKTTQHEIALESCYHQVSLIHRCI